MNPNTYKTNLENYVKCTFKSTNNIWKYIEDVNMTIATEFQIERNLSSAFIQLQHPMPFDNFVIIIFFYFLITSVMSEYYKFPNGPIYTNEMRLLYKNSGESKSLRFYNMSDEKLILIIATCLYVALQHVYMFETVNNTQIGLSIPTHHGTLPNPRRNPAQMQLYQRHLPTLPRINYFLRTIPIPGMQDKQSDKYKQMEKDFTTNVEIISKKWSNYLIEIMYKIQEDNLSDTKMLDSMSDLYYFEC